MEDLTNLQSSLADVTNQIDSKQEGSKEPKLPPLSELFDIDP